MADLFSPLQLGSIQTANRIFMAPLTRCRAEDEHVPTPLMAEYYAQRASAGLIIAEATMILPGNSAFWHEPGIYSAAQIDGWRLVTDAVHSAGGKIALQLWHGGRACHPDLNDGAVPVAPSAIAIKGEEVHTPNGKQNYTEPRALKDDEIPAIVQGFAQAALNARSAGFDMVEVHAANGYLLDEFLRDGSNIRSGIYGGSMENRARLLFETLTAVSNAIGADLVGVRLSPLNSFNDMRDRWHGCLPLQDRQRGASEGSPRLIRTASRCQGGNLSTVRTRRTRHADYNLWTGFGKKGHAAALGRHGDR